MFDERVNKQCKRRGIVALVLIAMHALPGYADIIDGEELVDPTRPFFRSVSGESAPIEDLFRTVVPASFDLTFVRAGSTNPIAVINNQRVTIGDMIGGATVVTIDRGGVTLLVNEEERRISLYGNNVKTPVTER